MAQNNTTATTVATATAKPTESVIINVLKKGIKIEGFTVSELLEMSTEQVKAIGQAIEERVANANGTPSFFGPRKASKEDVVSLQVIKEIYEDMLADEQAIAKAQSKEKTMAILLQKKAEIEAAKYNNLTAEQIDQKIDELQNQD